MCQFLNFTIMGENLTQKHVVQLVILFLCNTRFPSCLNLCSYHLLLKMYVLHIPFKPCSWRNWQIITIVFPFSLSIQVKILLLITFCVLPFYASVLWFQLTESKIANTDTYSCRSEFSGSHSTSFTKYQKSM